MATPITQVLDLQARVSAAGIKDMTAAVDRLDKQSRGSAGGFNEMSKAASSSGASLASLTKNAASLGVGFIGVTSALAAVKIAFTATIGQAAAFETRLSVLKAQSGATAEQMAQISQRAKDLGNDLTLPGVSASDAAVAMLELSKAGLSVNDTMAAAKGALQLAKTENIAFGTAAETVANNLNAFRLRGDEATRVADLLAGASAAASGTVLQMGQGLQQVASIAQGANQKIEDTVTALALMAKAGIQGSDAGTSLKTALLALQAPTDKAAGLMSEYGINVRDANGQMLPMRALIAELTAKLGGLSDAQRDAALKTIFGNDAYDKMAASVTQAGSAQRLAAAQAAGLSGAIAGLQSQVETIALELGQKMTPALTDFVQALSAALSSDLLATFGTGLLETVQTVGLLVTGFQAMPEPLRIAAIAVLGLTAALTVLSLHPVIGTLTLLTAGLVLLAGKVEEANNRTAASTEDLYTRAQAIVASGLGLAKDATQRYTKELAALDDQGASSAQKLETLRARHEELNKSINANASALLSLAERTAGNKKAQEEAAEEVARLKQLITDEAVQMGVLDQIAGKLGHTLSTDVKTGATEATRAIVGIGEASKGPATADQALKNTQKLLQAIFADGREVQKVIRDIVSPPTGTEAVLLAQLSKIEAGLKGAGAAARTSGDEKGYWINKSRELFAAAGLEADVLTRANGVLDRVATGTLNAADAEKILTDILAKGIEKRQAVVDAEAATREAAGLSAEAQLKLGLSLNTVEAKAQEAANVFNGIFTPSLDGSAGAADGMSAALGRSLSHINAIRDAIKTPMTVSVNFVGQPPPWLPLITPGSDTPLEAGAKQTTRAMYGLRNAMAEVSMVPKPTWVADAAGGGGTLKALEAESRRVRLAIERLNLELLNAEPLSAHAAAIEKDIAILRAWDSKISATTNILKLQRDELEASKTALDGFTQAQTDAVTGAVRAQQFGGGAGLVGLLTGDLSDPAIGAKISDALETLIGQAITALGPSGANLGGALRDAVLGFLANPTKENLAFVNSGIAALFEAAQAAVAFNAPNLQTALSTALNLSGLTELVGTQGIQIIDALDDVWEEGKTVSNEKVAQLSAGVLTALGKLPADIGGPLAEEYRAAIIDFAVNPTQEGMDRVKGILTQAHTILSNFPNDIRKLSPEVRAAMDELTRAYRAGEIGPQQYAERTRTVAEVVPKDLHKMDASGQEAIASLTAAYLAGTIGPEMYAASVEFAVEAAGKRLEEVKRLADAAKSEMEEARKWFEANGFDKPFPGTTAAGTTADGVGGGTGDAVLDPMGRPTSGQAAWAAATDFVGAVSTAMSAFGGGVVQQPDAQRLWAASKGAQDELRRIRELLEEERRKRLSAQGITAFASGGLISKPTMLLDARTGRAYGTMAEVGPEWIVPAGGYGSVNGRGGGSVGGGGGGVHVYQLLPDARAIDRIERQREQRAQLAAISRGRL